MDEKEAEVVDVSELMKTELASQILYLGDLEPGTEKHSTAVNDIAKLYSAFNAMLETEGKFQVDMAELEQKKEQFEKEMELKTRQLEEEKASREAQEAKEKKDSLTDLIFKSVDMALKAAIPALTLCFYRQMFTTGLKFEEKGAISSQSNKWLISKFKPNKLD